MGGERGVLLHFTVCQATRASSNFSQWLVSDYVTQGFSPERNVSGFARPLSLLQYGSLWADTAYDISQASKCTLIAIK